MPEISEKEIDEIIRVLKYLRAELEFAWGVDQNDEMRVNIIIKKLEELKK